VVDLVHDELVLVDGSETALHAWLSERLPRADTLLLERVGEFPTVVIRAGINSFAELPVLPSSATRKPV